MISPNLPIYPNRPLKIRHLLPLSRKHLRAHRIIPLLQPRIRNHHAVRHLDRAFLRWAFISLVLGDFEPVVAEFVCDAGAEGSV